jgi:hypothetical protein
VQVLAAHRVELAGDRKAGGALLDQHTADAGAARLPVDPGEDDEHPGFLGAADQGFDRCSSDTLTNMGFLAGLSEEAEVAQGRVPAAADDQGVVHGQAERLSGLDDVPGDRDVGL